MLELTLGLGFGPSQQGGSATVPHLMLLIRGVR